MSLTFILVATLISLSFAQNINPDTIWGDCASFSVHGGTDVSFNGVLTSVLTGSVGVSPGTSILGSYSLGTGAIELGTSAAVKCAASKLITYANLTAQTCGTTLASSDLAGLTLLPGVYCSTFGFFTFTSGTLTLNGNGSAHSKFVFQTATTLVTSTGTSFILQNSQLASNIFWRVGSSATLASSSTFIGQISAGASISVDTTCTLNGRAMAHAAVSFAGGDVVTLPQSSTNAPTTTSPPTKAPTNAPTNAPTESVADINAAVNQTLSNASIFSGPGYTFNNVTFEVEPTSTQDGRIKFSVTCPSTCDEKSVCSSITTTLYSLLSATLSPPPCKSKCLSCSLSLNKRRSVDATSTFIVVTPAGYNSSSNLMASFAIFLLVVFIAM